MMDRSDALTINNTEKAGYSSKTLTAIIVGPVCVPITGLTFDRYTGTCGQIDEIFPISSLASDKLVPYSTASDFTLLN